MLIFLLFIFLFIGIGIVILYTNKSETATQVKSILREIFQNIKDLSKDFVDQLSEETKNKLSEKNITDNERYILNHKLDALKEIRV